MYLIRWSLLILVLGLCSKSASAQLISDVWILQDIYTVDSVGDTMYATTIDTINGGLQPTFPKPFRAERSYYAYLVWEDTSGTTVIDSIGVMIPAVKKMEIGIEMEVL
jgi:hypothetical protein